MTNLRVKVVIDIAYLLHALDVTSIFAFYGEDIISACMFQR
jgi:hypothetical protein